MDGPSDILTCSQDFWMIESKEFPILNLQPVYTVIENSPFSEKTLLFANHVLLRFMVGAQLLKPRDYKKTLAVGATSAGATYMTSNLWRKIHRAVPK